MDRKALKAQYKELYTKIEEILFRVDPIGITFKGHPAYEANSDEYNLEVDSILPRLKQAHSQQDVLNIIHEEFVRWFGEGTAGSKSSGAYLIAAKEIWSVWSAYNRRLPGGSTQS